jgi:hypothetical protein
LMFNAMAIVASHLDLESSLAPSLAPEEQQSLRCLYFVHLVNGENCQIGPHDDIIS